MILSKFIAGQQLNKAFGWFVLVMSLCILVKETILSTASASSQTRHQTSPDETPWKAPDMSKAADEKNADLIYYGRDLIANTAFYLGPKGKVAHLSNGMNCQNCHLNAGTKPWGNNFGAVAAIYPKFRERSGTRESIVKRITDCFERSLNGRAPDSTSREMRAMLSYIQFIGQEVPKGKSPKGSGLWPIPFLDRAANPAKGKLAYQQKCVTCHGSQGQGRPTADRTGYTFPPLWGNHSYNIGAGLFRISRLAGYLKANMPLGANWDTPQLSDEEAWDLAAYVNSLPRPVKDLSQDWPNIKGKPVDHPFGPYADQFSENQHKYGPFAPIEQFKKNN
jgi:thiosulfate dehydrogenase